MQKVIPETAVLVPSQAEKVFTGQIFDVYQWQQTLFDNSQAMFEMLKRPDTVFTICIVDGRIVIIEDTQPHSGTRISFPGGRVDATDITTEEAAKREVHEETGYSFHNWRLIQVRQPYKKMEWFIYLYLAWDIITKEEPHVDPGETIEQKTVSFPDLKTSILNKTGSLTEARSLFESLSDLDELLALPQFTGKNVDR
jgi:ADP-ribose pyrophosphatase YjhB (NUDIX family)